MEGRLIFGFPVSEVRETGSAAPAHREDRRCPREPLRPIAREIEHPAVPRGRRRRHIVAGGAEAGSPKRIVPLRGPHSARVESPRSLPGARASRRRLDVARFVDPHEHTPLTCGPRTREIRWPAAGILHASAASRRATPPAWRRSIRNEARSHKDLKHMGAQPGAVASATARAYPGRGRGFRMIL